MIHIKYQSHELTFWCTSDERISKVIVVTFAGRCVISDVAVGVDTANRAKRAWIHALVFKTDLVTRAVRIETALLSAACLWISLEVWQARADGSAADNLANGVVSTWAWHARILGTWIRWRSIGLGAPV